MTEFVASAKDGTYAEKGFKGTTYGMSKVGLSALTRIQQQEFDKVNCTLCFYTEANTSYKMTTSQ